MTETEPKPQRATATGGFLARVRSALARAWQLTASERIAWPLLIAAFSLPAAFARVLMHLDRGVGLAAVDLRGLSSDLFCAAWLLMLSVALLRTFEGRLSRALVTSLALTWALLNYGGYEHVLANDATVDVVALRYLGDANFVQGSSSFSRPFSWALMMALGGVLAWRSSGHVAHPQTRPWPSLANAALWTLIVTLWVPAVTVRDWRQENFLEQAPRRLANAASGHGRVVGNSSSDDPLVEAALGRNLDPPRRAALPKKPHNVLVLLVEGASGGYLPSLAEYHDTESPMRMPKLDARAQKEALVFSQFIAQQRQTNRGEYAVLCGEPPKLSSKTSKMTDYVLEPGAECLPSILQREGYTTAYHQAADLSFMMKDKFMALIGFDEVLGSETFKEGYTSTGWGIDDKALYEQVLDRVEGYEKTGKPWFTTVLNVGTHHPWRPPKDFERQKGETRRAHAFRYTDEAVVELLDGLRDRGMLDHTLVFVMSDESQGLGAGESKGGGGFYEGFTENWGLMAVFAPGYKAGIEKTPYVHSDIGLSILDYLGLADAAPHFKGHSMFRQPGPARTIPFANTYHTRQYTIDPEGKMVVCREGSDACQGYQLDPLHLFSTEMPTRELVDGESEFLKTLVAHTETTESSQRREHKASEDLELIDVNATVFDLSVQKWDPVIMSGQYVALDRRTKLHVELEFTVLGEGTEVEIRTEIQRRVRGDHRRLAADPLRAGETMRIEFDYVPTRATTDLNVMVSAHRVKRGEHPRLVVEKASATIVRAEEGAKDFKAGMEIFEFTRVLADGTKLELPYFEVTADSRNVRDVKCLKLQDDGGYLGKNCKAKPLMAGPRGLVVKGQKIGSKMVVQAGRQPVKVFWRRKGKFKGKAKSTPQRSETFTIPARKRMEVSTVMEMIGKSRGMGLTLVLEEPASGFRIYDYTQWIEPIKRRTRFSRKGKATREGADAGAPDESGETDGGDDDDEDDEDDDAEDED